MYQLCQPSSVKVSAATMPKVTHTALPSGRMAEPGLPSFFMISSLEDEEGESQQELEMELGVPLEEEWRRRSATALPRRKCRMAVGWE